MIKIKAGIAALVAAGISLSACSTIAAPDEVGLYYLEGNSDGYKFHKCIEPGQTGDSEWNNSVVYLPTSVKTWNIGGEGSDFGQPIVSSSKPQEGQPSGVEVQVWPKVTFKLNTYCNGPDSPVVTFWETLGRSKEANTPGGWRKLMQDTVHTALEKVTRDVTRGYPADDMVGNVNGINTTVQTDIAKQFAIELKRMAGGDFFCGPTFDRRKNECPAIEVIIKDVTYNDPGIQSARNEKQKAVELAAAKLATAQGEAAALLAEAKGKKDAAAELAALYANPNWVRLQEAIIQLEAMKACGENPNCHMIVGADGNVLISPK